jgi:aminopeptidase N
MGTTNARHRGRSMQLRFGTWPSLVVSLLLACSLQWPVAPDASAKRADEPLPVAGSYGIDVVLSPEERQLAGHLTLDWINRTGEAATVLPFRLYPEADLYKDGSLRVGNVQINGKDVESRQTGDGTVLEVTPGKPIEPNEQAVVAMDFVTTIPTRSEMSVTVLAGAVDDGWWLADWYPILAGWDPEDGWYLEDATPYGDPTYSDSATYELTLTAPDDLMVLGTGETSNEEPAGDGMVRTTISTGPVREMTLALLPDAAGAPVEVTERSIDGVLVRVSLPAGQAVPSLAEAMLDFAEETMPHYQAWLGPYPGRDLDITPVSLSGFGGIAWSGAVWIDIDSFVGDGEISTAGRDQLRFVLAHELAHQWVPVVVGSNNNRHGFLSEGLASTLAILAFRESGEGPAAERYLREQVTAGYLSLLESGVDGVADAPVGPETDMAQRGPLVYGKAATGFEAIRQLVGQEAFIAALSLYGAEFRFGNTVPGDLLAALEEASGMDLDAEWSFWFLEARCTPEDVYAVLDGFAG